LRACVLGVSIGCTKRAAGMLAQRGDDPGIQRCTSRTFEKTCARENAWGCSMYGLALIQGSGVARDLGRARDVLPGGCRHGPDDDACKAARKLMEKIGDTQ
jgi:hypothetical protein